MIARAEYQSPGRSASVEFYAMQAADYFDRGY